MNYLITLILILSTSSSLASFKNFDFKSNRTTKYPVISKRVFQRTVEKMGEEFSYLADSFNEKLLTYASWIDPTYDQALARRWDSAQVLVYRGMAHRRELNRDALALVVCHELGHLYAGQPLKNENDFIAAEGQADYFATKHCIRKALAIFDEKNIEERAIEATKAVGEFLANNWGHKHPRTDTPDESVVDTTNLSYPTPQCRFDTYMAGLKGELRPRCWYVED